MLVTSLQNKYSSFFFYDEMKVNEEHLENIYHECSELGVIFISLDNIKTPLIPQIWRVCP